MWLRSPSQPQLLVDGSDEFMDSHVEALHENSHLFVSTPPPPEDLWRTEDVHFLDKVVCTAWALLTSLDPKNGSFQVRLKLHWFLRTLYTSHDRTEPRVRVPGVRAPRLDVKVKESRLWREMANDSTETMCWKGTTELVVSGYEIFEVHDFPFDRQLIHLDLVEFVWRDDQDTTRFVEAMQVVYLSVVTLSTIPEWDAFTALVVPQDITNSSSNCQKSCGFAKGEPIARSRFFISLRFQRKPNYYITQIFLVALLIMLVALLPLGLEPGNEHVSDRLSIHSGGVLTLVAFKYSVAADLPHVHYGTFTTNYLNRQLLTCVGVSIECMISYKLVVNFPSIKHCVDSLEDVLLVSLATAWIAYFYSCASKRSAPWAQVLENQMGSHMNDCEYESPMRVQRFQKALEGLEERVEDSISHPEICSLSSIVRRLLYRRSASKSPVYDL